MLDGGEEVEWPSQGILGMGQYVRRRLHLPRFISGCGRQVLLDIPPGPKASFLQQACFPWLVPRWGPPTPHDAQCGHSLSSYSQSERYLSLCFFFTFKASGVPPVPPRVFHPDKIIAECTSNYFGLIEC